MATIAASAMTDVPADLRTAPVWTGRDFGASGTPPPAPRPSPVLTGIDVLRASGFTSLRGKRVGLLTNHTGRARDGATTIDVLHGVKDPTLVRLFSPEHGIRGILDASVPSAVDETGLTINSLYGETRRPTGAMLDGLDTIVIDLQDIGARFYTYMTTMAYVMEEAAAHKVAVVVLDRPNPVNGFQVEGPTLDKAALSFVGYFPMPIGLILDLRFRILDCRRSEFLHLLLGQARYMTISSRSAVLRQWLRCLYPLRTDRLPLIAKHVRQNLL